jgi:hypothetical protein
MTKLVEVCCVKFFDVANLAIEVSFEAAKKINVVKEVLWFLVPN